MAQEFSQSGVKKYFPLQEKQMRMLVRNILNDPTQLAPQINLYAINDLTPFQSVNFIVP
jgi:hypothetical protein